ncbi:lamin tail domain-containing protein [Candidatus Woesearchaeota archaeon]|nr:lamin tail domain-containing protein [Candidatus Woesearchaeota archaeon]
MLFLFLASALVQANILINEIMYDPAGNDNDREFVEIYHSPGFLNLSGYIVGDAVSNDTLVGVSYSSASYSLIVEEGFNATGMNASIYSVGKTIGNNLNNDQDRVVFYYPNGTLIDIMNYSSSLGGNNNGYSLERDEFSIFTESLVANGTPGRQNSVIPACTVSLVNSSWSGWLNQTSCLSNDTLRQNRSLIQYDANRCGTVENVSFWEFQDTTCYFGFQGDIAEINSTLSNLTLTKSNGTVTFFEAGFPLFFFPFNFTNNTFTFADIFIRQQLTTESSGYLLLAGLDLTVHNKTKNFNLQKMDAVSNAVCILDAEVRNVSALSSGCTEPNETIVRCDGELHVDYTCTSNGTQYTVSGLHHSFVREFTIADETPPPSGFASGGGGGSSSCPSGMKLVGRRCVAEETRAEQSPEQSVVPVPREGTVVSPSAELTEEDSIPSSRIIEKDIELSLRDGNKVSRKTIVEGNQLTGAAIGFNDVASGEGMMGMVALALLALFSCAAAWVMVRRK